MAAMLMAADPASAPPAVQRSQAEVLRDWDLVSEQIRAMLPSPRAIQDREAREEVAPAGIPLLRKAIGLNTEMYHLQKDMQGQCRRQHYFMLAILSFLGDKPATEELIEAKSSNHKQIAACGEYGWYLSQWWLAGEDVHRGKAILDEVEAAAEDRPADDNLAATLMQLRQEGCATDEQDTRIQQILAKMTSPKAVQASATFRAAEKRRSLLGKPLVVKSKTVKGEEFSSESLKGKTVIVHFGATWCGPWQQQHEQLMAAERLDDVAVVTVLCDEKASDVEVYLERHKEAPWPMLRDAESPTGFAAQFGVEDLPATIVLDGEGKVTAIDLEAADVLRR